MSLEVNDYREFELDVKNTIIVNILPFCYMLLMFYFIFIMLNFITTFEQNQQIILLIVFMLVVLELIRKSIGLHLEYKFREKTK